jgi:hypothetical protein
MMEFLKGIAKSLVELLVLNIVLVPIMVLGPLLYVIPFFCIVANLLDNFSGLAQLYFWLGPLSCAFWMLVSCHWPIVRRAQREGRLATWRESEGGIVCTILKAFVYMVLGLLGSFVFEITFVVVFRFRRGNPASASNGCTGRFTSRNSQRSRMPPIKQSCSRGTRSVCLPASCFLAASKSAATEASTRRSVPRES